MLTAQLPVKHKSARPINDASVLSNLLREALREVTDVIAPVWPLQDYVAVNPYAGISGRPFMDARAFMKGFSDCETLMPLSHYASEFRKGHFTVSHIELAIEELSSSGVSLGQSAAEIADLLSNLDPTDICMNEPQSQVQPDRKMRTMAEYVSEAVGISWTEAIVEEVSKHCSAHYDQGQSVWTSPYQDMPLYQAWRKVAQYDRNIEILGLSGFRDFVASLPLQPEAAILHLMHRLRIPHHLWCKFLLCQAFSILGWCAWSKYKSYWTDEKGTANNDFAGLLAIRLAYDVALAESKSLRVDWTSISPDCKEAFKSHGTEQGDDSLLRYALLRASELDFRGKLLESLSISNIERIPVQVDRRLAQMVFCIDVRSERIRRQIETQSSDIETFGFAGFFGMAFEYVKLGQQSGNSQLPVLLKPQFKLHEGLNNHSDLHDVKSEALVTSKSQEQSSWLSLWQSFQASAVSCFSFVETTGLLYGWKLLKRASNFKFAAANTERSGLPAKPPTKIGPTLRGLDQQGVTVSHQTDLVEKMLRNLGLTKNFAKIVVFCGHGCQTENNPLAAGLDCGACGGHSGEPNARFAALLLNQPAIRQMLVARGIDIPADTYFLAALHNTTTDAIEFYDLDGVPPSHRTALQELTNCCALATRQTQSERLPVIASKSLVELLKRASDWSEVRPEWGLAGNAAFIVAPRALTKNANLDARSFLHSYDYTQDEDGKVLETIMTAPMIVANWINMQYYASTVDNHYFGSGNKTVHNVVGRFGILSGNGGDLMTGLPWQSLHSGKDFQHLPMRLQVVIAAPRRMMDDVITKHGMVANLLNGGWIHLVAIEGENLYRYCKNGEWEQICSDQTARLS